jgi:hypothetical protein
LALQKSKHVYDLRILTVNVEVFEKQNPIVSVKKPINRKYHKLNVPTFSVSIVYFLVVKK